MEQTQTEFDLMVIDADTPCHTASMVIQTKYIIVTRNSDGKQFRCKNMTEWHGHYKKKEGGILKRINDRRIANGEEPYSVDDFTLTEHAELSTDIDNHLEYAVEHFDRFVGKIKRTGFADDYLLVVGGVGNFRYDCAQIQPYKGQRKEKPLMFTEVKEAILKKYKNKIRVVDGIEADDYCSIKGRENYLHYKRTGEWKYILGYVDKDLDMIVGPSFNYTDQEPEIKWTNEGEAALCFASQILTGDSTDNIAGLPNFAQETQEKYNLGKTRGIGKATAFKYLKDCETPKEMYERVAEAYKDYYGDERKEFVTHRGEKVEWNWLGYMQDNAKLLWLKVEEGEVFDVRKLLSK